jgi:hypothetical protein
MKNKLKELRFYYSTTPKYSKRGSISLHKHLNAISGKTRIIVAVVIIAIIVFIIVQWQATVDTVMNLPIPYEAGNFLTI